jgi:hypothetical protein
MGFSKLKIPKICEFCEKPFEAKTITQGFVVKLVLINLERDKSSYKILRRNNQFREF